MAIKVKKSDRVRLTAGKDRGKEGKVLFVDTKTSRIVVEGLNLVRKTKRPDQQNQKGGIIDIEAPLHVSNVMIVCPKCSSGMRVKHKKLENGKKVRVCGKCGEVLDKV
jgi:large subunit ribosomal protein L24